MPNDPNHDENQPADLNLINYKLNQLMSTTVTGFGELKTYYVDLEKRVNVLEIWKAGEDAADKIRAAESERQTRAERDRQADQPKTQSAGKDQTDNFIKIIFIVLGLLGTALGLVGSGLFK